MDNDWTDICAQPPLSLTNNLLIDPNVHKLPPIFASAATCSSEDSFNPIEKDLQPSTSTSASVSASASPLQSTESELSNATESNQSELNLSESGYMSQNTASSTPVPTTTSESASEEAETKIQEDSPFQTLADFLPEKSYYYNSRGCYIFPGAEIWWNKDSDNDSTTSDSSANDDEDGDEDEADIDIEIDNIKNELERSYSMLDNIQIQSNHELLIASDHQPIESQHVTDQSGDSGNAVEANECSSTEMTANIVIDRHVVETVTTSQVSEISIRVDENVLDNTNENEFNKYLLKRSAETSLDHIELNGDIGDFGKPKRQKSSSITLADNDCAADADNRV